MVTLLRVRPTHDAAAFATLLIPLLLGCGREIDVTGGISDAGQHCGNAGRPAREDPVRSRVFVGAATPVVVDGRGMEGQITETACAATHCLVVVRPTGHGTVGLILDSVDASVVQGPIDLAGCSGPVASNGHDFAVACDSMLLRVSCEGRTQGSPTPRQLDAVVAHDGRYLGAALDGPWPQLYRLEGDAVVPTGCCDDVRYSAEGSFPQERSQLTGSTLGPVLLTGRVARLLSPDGSRVVQQVDLSGVYDLGYVEALQESGLPTVVAGTVGTRTLALVFHWWASEGGAGLESTSAWSIDWGDGSVRELLIEAPDAYIVRKWLTPVSGTYFITDDLMRVHSDGTPVGDERADIEAEHILVLDSKRFALLENSDDRLAPPIQLRMVEFREGVTP